MSDLDIRIQKVGDGKSIHTRNKARYYLDTMTGWRKGALEKLCEEALRTGEWKPVTIFIGGRP